MSEFECSKCHATTEVRHGQDDTTGLCDECAQDAVVDLKEGLERLLKQPKMGEMVSIILELQSRLEESEAANAVMREAFSKYGEHLAWCDYGVHPDKECTCGLLQLKDNLTTTGKPLLEERDRYKKALELIESQRGASGFNYYRVARMALAPQPTETKEKE